MKRIQSIIYLVFIIGSMALLVFSASSYENPFSLDTSQKVIKKLQGVEEDEWAWAKSIIKVFTKSNDIETEEEIILDHNYDGIRELDNVLPPWWVGLFYATIIFAVIYMVRYRVMNVGDQADEYVTEMAIAKKEMEAYKNANPNTFDISKAELLSDADALAKGKEVFMSKCAACHQADGGGQIGPNLTDKYWINGGGFKNVIKTIYNGKGAMPSWKSLGGEKVQKVASYVLSLQGTKPAKPKKPEGDLWEEK